MSGSARLVHVQDQSSWIASVRDKDNNDGARGAAEARYIGHAVECTRVQRAAGRRGQAGSSRGIWTIREQGVAVQHWGRAPTYCTPGSSTEGNWALVAPQLIFPLDALGRFCPRSPV